MKHTIEELEAAIVQVDHWKFQCSQSAQYHLENDDACSYGACVSTNATYDTIRDTLTQALAIAKGDVVVVPKEPTIKMTNKVTKYFTCNSKNLAIDCYKAMINAAQEGK